MSRVDGKRGPQGPETFPREADPAAPGVKVHLERVAAGRGVAAMRRPRRPDLGQQDRVAPGRGEAPDGQPAPQGELTPHDGLPRQDPVAAGADSAHAGRGDRHGEQQRAEAPAAGGRP